MGACITGIVKSENLNMKAYIQKKVSIAYLLVPFFSDQLEKRGFPKKAPFNLALTLMKV
jgi:hypothetical protein